MAAPGSGWGSRRSRAAEPMRPHWGEQGVAEQVRPYFQAVKPAFVARRADAGQAGLVGEQWQLERFGHRDNSGAWA